MKLRREIIQLGFCSVIILSIIHFLTRPKVYVDTEIVTEIEYVDRIVEIDKIIEIPTTVRDTIYQYLDSDGLDFDVVFKMYREKVGPEKLFYWRNTLYTTNWRQEN